MRAPLVLDFVAIDHPPERGWPPFCDWLLDQGVDPSRTRSLHITAEGLGQVVLYVLDDEGRRRAAGNESMTETVTVRLSSPPPLHPSRRSAA